ncbi:MAG: zinc metalloprotease HtpX [Hyphomicrobiaceae bacterium]
MSPFLNPKALRAHKLQNTIQTVLIMAGMGILLTVCAMLVFGAAGLGWAAVLVGLLLVLLPRVPPELLMTMYRARRVAPGSGGQLDEIVTVLAERAKLPARPTLYIVPSMALNAFATGRPDHAVIAVTEGLLRKLTLREVANVLAHEMSHIRNNDLWVMGVADVVTRLAQALSYVGVFLAILNVLGALEGEQYASWTAVLLLYLAPTLSSLLQLALSRTREFDADVEGAQLTGDPLGLASALRRLELHSGQFWEDLMMPVPGRRVAYPSLLRSHPPTEERVRRLVALSNQPMGDSLVVEEEPMISLVGFGPIQMRPRHRFPGVWF